MTTKNKSKADLPKNSKKLKKQSKLSASTELSLNRQTLLDIVNAWLYATRMLDEDQKVIDIKIEEEVLLKVGK